MDNTSMERKLRYALKKAGYSLHKSRIRNINIDNMGGYMVTSIYTNAVIAGSRFDLSLEDVAEIAAEI